jgi:hypothetical protein
METLEALTRQPAWNIHRFEQVGQEIKPQPWFEVDSRIVGVLAVREEGLEGQIAELPSQIQFWGHMEALAERALQWEMRQLRVWKSKIHLSMVTPPDPTPKDWKKPTEATVEATYRQMPDYELLQARIDRASEALTATRYVREAWLAKTQLMRLSVRRGHDDAMSFRA